MHPPGGCGDGDVSRNTGRRGCQSAIVSGSAPRKGRDRKNKRAVTVPCRNIAFLDYPDRARRNVSLFGRHLMYCIVRATPGEIWAPALPEFPVSSGLVVGAAPRPSSRRSTSSPKQRAAAYSRRFFPHMEWTHPSPSLSREWVWGAAAGHRAK